MYNFRMKNKKIKPYLKIIKQIELVRSKNNKNWMDLLRLSLKLDHKTASKILSEIYKEDKKNNRKCFAKSCRKSSKNPPQFSRVLETNLQILLFHFRLYFFILIFN